jgi:hypothetical protein
MKTIGVITSVLGAALAALAVAVGIRSIPDIKRYLKMRAM